MWNKCVRYWPTAEEKEREYFNHGGSLRVQHLAERHSDNYTLRELRLSRNLANEVSNSLYCAGPLSNGDQYQHHHHHHHHHNHLCHPQTSGLSEQPVTPMSSIITKSQARSTSPATVLGKDGAYTVYHYHFTVWPDHGTPADPSCVLDFMHDISARQVGDYCLKSSLLCHPIVA
ncbi:unnamed protein product [Protopolystoma xenopodis]|uniref:Tyrosine-protein phosphatase domain-containing protein n=1 Tax=Protopolystoma xenopodis TaxID=117903 RepID=A0A448WH95_9PLAT|nr:unnamed protein product [Protopolystoma xenopodis]